MSVHRFHHRDEDYRAWLESHSAGYVVNLDFNDLGPRLHRASCYSLQSPIEQGKDLTGSYAKACSNDREELRREIDDPRPCALCAP